MGVASSLVRIGSSLLMLAIFSGAASASDSEHANSVVLSISRRCDFFDCEQELEECQDFCGLRLHSTIVQSLDLPQRSLIESCS